MGVTGAQGCNRSINFAASLSTTSHRVLVQSSGENPKPDSHFADLHVLAGRALFFLLRDGFEGPPPAEGKSALAAWPRPGRAQATAPELKQINGGEMQRSAQSKSVALNGLHLRNRLKHQT